MMGYQAIFQRVDGLEEVDIGPMYGLKGTLRADAENEALALPRPTDANFIKLIKEGRFEPPKLGFDL
jgi:hypothetical protein